MKRPPNYNTKQGEAILKYIATLGGEHVTIEQIAAHFAEEGNSIGITTIYRHMDKLLSSGRVRKFVFDGVAGACYQYIDVNEDPLDCFHLKCEDCGELIHLQNDLLGEIENRIWDDYIFKVNTMRTVFYGKCKACLKAD
ncbi:transcriptional repressor [Lachnospiraceae bacterium ZAX-1]